MRIYLVTLIAHRNRQDEYTNLIECFDYERIKSLLMRIIYSKFCYRKSHMRHRISQQKSVFVIEKCLSGVTRKSARFFVKRSLHTDWVTRSFTSANARVLNDTIGRKWRIFIFSLLLLSRRQGDSLRWLFVTPRGHLLTRQDFVNCVCPPNKYQLQRKIKFCSIRLFDMSKYIENDRSKRRYAFIERDRLINTNNVYIVFVL